MLNKSCDFENSAFNMRMLNWNVPERKVAPFIHAYIQTDHPTEEIEKIM